MKFIDESKLPEPPVGAHLISPRRGFKHHGLYIGKGKVIHYSGMARSFGIKEFLHIFSLIRYGSVVKTSLKYFCDGHGFSIVRHPHARFTGEACVERAKTRLCERSYYLYSNNCEHFVNWCIEDEFKSTFVTKFILLTAFILGMFHLVFSGKIFHLKTPEFRFVFGMFSAILGTSASVFCTLQSLQPALGMRGRERKNRYFGRIGMHIGAFVGIFLAYLGVKYKQKILLSLAPYFCPVLFGIGSYGLSRHYDTKRKEIIRKSRAKDFSK